MEAWCLGAGAGHGLQTNGARFESGARRCGVFLGGTSEFARGPPVDPVIDCHC